MDSVYEGEKRMSKMTLDAAIIHAKELSESQLVCKDCREEHKQLAEWLEELKQYKNEKRNAQEMFKRLGYKKEKNSIYEQLIISYKKDDGPGFCRICFSKPDKTIVARYFDVNGEMYAQVVKVQEFKAIQQQMRELGWI